MDAVDPNLIKAGTANFDWVNKGISSGMDYAAAQAQLQLKQQQLADAQQQAAQTKQLADFHTATLIGNGIDEINRNTGPVRKARIQTYMNQMSALGKPVSPEMQAMLGDESYAQTMQTMMAGFNKMSPEDKAQALPQIGQWQNSTDPVTGAQAFIDQQSKLQKLGTDQQKSANDTQKVQIAAAAQQTKAQDVGVKDQVAQQNANTLAAKAASQAATTQTKGVGDLSNKVTKIENTYAKLESPIQDALTAIKQGTQAGDRATQVALTKAVGVNRFNKSESDLLGPNLGNYSDQAQQAVNIKVGDGGIYDPSNRQQIVNLLTGLSANVQSDKKNQISPYYMQAKTNFPTQLAAGSVISPKSKALFEGGLSLRPVNEQNSILKFVGQGKSYDAIVQGMTKGGATPITQQEYQQAKDKLGLK